MQNVHCSKIGDGFQARDQARAGAQARAEVWEKALAFRFKVIKKYCLKAFVNPSPDYIRNCIQCHRLDRSLLQYPKEFTIVLGIEHSN